MFRGRLGRVASLLAAVGVVLACLAGTAGLTSASARVLQEGMWGDDVRELQELLREIGFSTINPNGVFGPETTAAVRRLQQAVGLAADGVVGPQTWAVVEALRTPYRYRVQTGDTLWDIARRFGTTMESIMDANGMEETTLRPGQVLVIPSVRRLHVPMAMRVRDLAARLGVAAQDVARLNGLGLNDTMRAGSEIWVPLPAL
ncbi:LysM peptidoglycan-binding domain-containing protein [Geochorda subterranea]|uniref:LysM peptidoglycan-binding domain-containing protein n=1 Tax=Geochorda subterranea TaxID=3109564 RepID=A0ABZ1BQW0_9FIRM|nr:LysM peptidoglycan-binding domain-containing protein [Limnochorda sp. LNt]WRP15089.1 LysM peptidoglycan-binding domain-containing protein [Limnochorda sp. LNt]